MEKGISIILINDNNEENSDIMKTIKSILSGVENINCQIILANTYKISNEYEIRTLCNNAKIMLNIMNLFNESHAMILNNAIKVAHYDYLSMIEVDDSFKKASLKLACNFLKENEKIIDIVAFEIKYGKQNHKLNRKRFAVNKIINVNISPQLFQYEMKGTIIKKECFKNYYFDNSMKYNMENHFMLHCLLSNPNYGVIKKGTYLSGKYLGDQYDELICTRNIDWYIDAAKYYFIKILRDTYEMHDDIPEFIQYALYYDFQFRFAANLSNMNKQALIGENIDEFYSLTKEFLSYIKDAIIINNYNEKLYILSKTFTLNLLYLKYDYNKPLNEIICSNDILGTYKDIFVENMKSIPLKITNFEFENKVITIYFELTCPFNQDQYNIIVKNANDIFKCSPINIYNLTKCFGRVFFKRHAFMIKIPINEKKQKQNFSFFARFSKVDVPLNIKVIKSHAKLFVDFKNAYWYKNNYIIQANKKSIVITKASKNKYIMQEIKYLIELLFTYNKSSKLAFIIRCLYWLTRPYYKNKKIWLTFDKKYKGGDNGEYFFRYASKQNDGITKYYLLEKSSKDYSKLKKQKLKLVSSRTLKLYLILLNTDIVFATHCDVVAHVEFSPFIEKYFRGLFNFETVCIQHGLTIQKIAHTANKIFDNTKYYYCASKYEIINLLDPEYGYKKEELRLTGIPRYDGLINNSKKQILITPTWRRSIASKVQNGKIRPYNSSFKDTSYFKLYNSLINNEKLINKAEEEGYKIIYLLHPTYAAQKNDFSGNKITEILTFDTGFSYEKLLTESSLMITDYSGVQFDFAYMRKPIVYSHFKDVPPYFEEGSFNYETMAFGEICTDIDEIVEMVCGYIDSNCKMKPVYMERCNEFFEYNDTNNCKRIYEESLIHQNKLNQQKEPNS